MLREQTTVDDAALLHDLALARSHIIAQGFFSYDAENRAMCDLVTALHLPASVLVVKLVLLDPDPVSLVPAAATLPAVPESAVQRPPAEEPEPGPGSQLMLGYVMVMAKRRQLKAYHTGPHIALTTADGDTRYSGTVGEVYAALKRDTVTQLPSHQDYPVQELRERLARCIGRAWTLEDNHDGHWTLARNGERMFTGAFEDIRLLAETRIFNTVENKGYA